MDTFQLGKRVRDARKAEGLTQAALAKKAGVGRRFIIDLEGGKPTVELGKALQVFRALDVSLIHGTELEELIRALDVPRLWSAPKNASPEQVFAAVLKDPTFHDVLRVAKVYGVKPLRKARRHLLNNGELSRIAADETARMLKNIQKGLHHAAG